MFKLNPISYLSLKDARTNLLLCILLFVDCTFIVIHFLNYFSLIAFNSKFSITKDHSYSEIYQYFKFGWISVINLLIFIKLRRFAYIFWFLFFLFLLADDSLTLHESIGLLFAKYLSVLPNGWIRHQDIGEIIFVMIIGSVFLTILLATLKWSDEVFQTYTFGMIYLVILLIMFGVGMDILHIVFRGGALNFLFGLLEDGGELVAASLILWYCAYAHLNIKRN